ncbi:hypothetical protein HBH56_144810 [Parastagonospora nodorum]|uniref:Uncharacterized protein n=1 Tax=Phaeosphaeria nodorum (strain SN15 / ATCC MYA-4574 / FGSC 10173) TaxID=321614 RepID=A0A7U2F9V5_PHANO|nr:hypothetical protein HBH56_144810 [Parastagonospora nodorum]QRD01380.1 hypothetical protein JI435_120510 [Parastagonospora nodorum SN15]KAH3927765.1 hypothetical protein HBH54_150000 [Parastagonospora nodorum]KAH3960108.1 hypothetical protein HBH51_193860 [Parastagonospora nodorum]KAH4031349.1 hypothetical protein HBI09_123590 [Parastagonospora nodorum]
MADFGWSASCILEAIKLSNKIRKALQDAGGAREQYTEAASFLTQFECVFKELEIHINDGRNTEYREAIEQQLKLMEPPWTRLQVILGKYENSLGDKSTKSKLKMVPRKVQWALKELNEAVRKGRDQVRGPLHGVSLLLQMQSMITIRDIDEKCQRIIDDLETADFARALQQDFAQLHLHTEEGTRNQTDIQKDLAQLRQTLHQQHAVILAALPVKTEAASISHVNADIETYQTSELTASVARCLDNYEDQGNAIVTVYAELQNQQASLEKVQKALQSLVRHTEQPTNEEYSRLSTATGWYEIGDAISTIRVAAFTASMFALGYHSRTAISAFNSSAQRIEQGTIQPEVKGRGRKSDELWTAEFARQNDASQPSAVEVPYSRIAKTYSTVDCTESTVNTTEKVSKASKILEARRTRKEFSDSLPSSYGLWHCKECGEDNAVWHSEQCPVCGFVL